MDGNSPKGPRREPDDRTGVVDVVRLAVPDGQDRHQDAIRVDRRNLGLAAARCPADLHPRVVDPVRDEPRPTGDTGGELARLAHRIEAARIQGRHDAVAVDEERVARLAIDPPLIVDADGRSRGRTRKRPEIGDRVHPIGPRRCRKGRQHEGDADGAQGSSPDAIQGRSHGDFLPWIAATLPSSGASPSRRRARRYPQSLADVKPRSITIDPKIRPISSRPRVKMGRVGQTTKSAQPTVSPPGGLRVASDADPPYQLRAIVGEDGHDTPLCRALRASPGRGAWAAARVTFVGESGRPGFYETKPTRRGAILRNEPNSRSIFLARWIGKTGHKP